MEIRKEKYCCEVKDLLCYLPKAFKEEEMMIDYLVQCGVYRKGKEYSLLSSSRSRSRSCLGQSKGLGQGSSLKQTQN